MHVFLMVSSALLITSTLLEKLSGYSLRNAAAPRYMQYSQLGFFGCMRVIVHQLALRAQCASSRSNGPYFLPPRK